MVGLQKIRAAFICTFLLCLAFCGQATAQKRVAPLVIGETFSIDSEVYAPARYNEALSRMYFL